MPQLNKNKVLPAIQKTQETKRALILSVLEDIFKYICAI